MYDGLGVFGLLPYFLRKPPLDFFIKPFRKIQASAHTHGGSRHILLKTISQNVQKGEMTHGLWKKQSRVS